MSPFETLPGVWLNVSQMLGLRPSSAAAPSIWYDAVAVPNVKPSGNFRPDSRKSSVLMTSLNLSIDVSLASAADVGRRGSR